MIEEAIKIINEDLFRDSTKKVRRNIILLSFFTICITLGNLEFTGIPLLGLGVNKDPSPFSGLEIRDFNHKIALLLILSFVLVCELVSFILHAHSDHNFKRERIIELMSQHIAFTGFSDGVNYAEYDNEISKLSEHLNKISGQTSRYYVQMYSPIFATAFALISIFFIKDISPLYPLIDPLVIIPVQDLLTIDSITKNKISNNPFVLVYDPSIIRGVAGRVIFLFMCLSLPIIIFMVIYKRKAMERPWLYPRINNLGEELYKNLQVKNEKILTQKLELKSSLEFVNDSRELNVKFESIEKKLLDVAEKLNTQSVDRQEIERLREESKNLKQTIKEKNNKMANLEKELQDSEG